MKRRMRLFAGALASFIVAIGGGSASAAECVRPSLAANYNTGETFWILPVVVIGVVALLVVLVLVILNLRHKKE